jgi:hypothetical protein
MLFHRYTIKVTNTMLLLKQAGLCLTLCVGLGATLLAQEFNDDLDEALQLDLLIGGSAAFSWGEYIDYQDFFAQIEEPNTEIRGGVQPLFGANPGLRAFYRPFEDETLGQLGISIGAMLVQGGFVNRYRFNTDEPDRDLKDRGTFIERYRSNYLSIPLTLTWGQNWFGEVGLSFNRFIVGSRYHKLTRRVSGADAYNGGFNTTDTYRESLGETIIFTSQRRYLIGGGKQLGDQMALRLLCQFSGETFSGFSAEGNFRNAIVMLQLAYNIYQP